MKHLEYIPGKYNYTFFKGRVALYAILEAMKIEPDDEIILPGYTCVVVPNAITYYGAKSIYADIDRSTYNIDHSKIEAKITKKTKAIIAQHTYGIPAKMDEILQIAKRHNLFVIEDSCHAIGSKYKGRDVGTFGDAAFFSSQWSKPVTTGLGGWAVINNPGLIEGMQKAHENYINPSFKEEILLRLQYLLYTNLLRPSTFWLAQNTYRMLSGLGIALGSSSNEELECRMPPNYAKKMSGWQSSLLMKKLSKIHEYIEHRRWVTRLYEDHLISIGIETLKLDENYEPVILRYPVVVKNKMKVLKAAEKKKLEIGDWFLSPVHPNLTGWAKVGYEKGMCPIAENVCQNVLNLPTHSGIGEEQVRRIVAFIASIN